VPEELIKTLAIRTGQFGMVRRMLLSMFLLGNTRCRLDQPARRFSPARRKALLAPQRLSQKPVDKKAFDDAVKLINQAAADRRAAKTEKTCNKKKKRRNSSAKGAPSKKKRRGSPPAKEEGAEEEEEEEEEEELEEEDWEESKDEELDDAYEEDNIWMEFLTDQLSFDMSRHRRLGASMSTSKQ
jgi:hypothetical protein